MRRCIVILSAAALGLLVTPSLAQEAEKPRPALDRYKDLDCAALKSERLAIFKLHGEDCIDPQKGVASSRPNLSKSRCDFFGSAKKNLPPGERRTMSRIMHQEFVKKCDK